MVDSSPTGGMLARIVVIDSRTQTVEVIGVRGDKRGAGGSSHLALVDA